ncbi:bifunctional cytidylyltransferase/SDR family oxidoreductase [Microbacterium sp. MPKO10]|uniref:bifunctional cytidylyltransferase/SDR family oxidoreductase n=1 Tax=Microbacterium sp. MPKO10 TaxID=2989818 RepID=UPI0022355593|nr:bifunctional cytidylyltransferase/SDR family oxidoreductase [Microbacterium sp. MPKO10]MCW4457825.1 bifunctional cytidylyltransferase/SDR family oxidoreductase [Microbacterium sp. MPKO10]
MEQVVHSEVTVESNEERMRTVAVILAGGVGVRVGLGIPKQLIKIAGKAIVEHTLEAIENNSNIDEIIIMMNAESIHELDHLRKDDRFSKLTRVLPGGETRNDTTKLALAALPDNECKVLFHDAVRPFIDDRILDDCVSALDTYDAVDTAIRSADTIIQVDDDGCISDMPDRSVLRRGQTPQAFKLSTIRRAYEIAADDPNFKATDDCGVIFTYLPDVKIYVVDGTAENMKVTEPIDIHIADKLFQLQSKSLSADSADLPSLTGKSVVVFGGSYGIGKSIAELTENLGARVFAFSRSETDTDVTSRSSVRRALNRAHAEAGSVDYVILTAGVLSVAPLVSAPKKEIKKTIRTNLTAPAIVAQEAFDFLKESQGSLTLFTSSSYTRGRAGYSLYSATKAGVVNLTQALAEEWDEDHVRVNCVNPQRTHTPMRTQAFGKEPENTLLSAEAVAEVSTRVMDSTMTGQVISVRL